VVEKALGIAGQSCRLADDPRRPRRMAAWWKAPRAPFPVRSFARVPGEQP